MNEHLFRFMTIRPSLPLEAKNCVVAYPKTEASQFIKSLRNNKEIAIKTVTIKNEQNKEILNRIHAVKNLIDLDNISIDHNPTENLVLKAVSDTASNFIKSNTFISDPDFDNRYNLWKKLIDKLQSISEPTMDLIDNEIESVFQKKAKLLFTDHIFIAQRITVADSFLAIMLAGNTFTDKDKKDKLALILRSYGIIDLVARYDLQTGTSTPSVIKNTIKNILNGPIIMPVSEFSSFKMEDHYSILQNAKEVKWLEIISNEKNELEKGLDRMENMNDDDLKPTEITSPDPSTTSTSPFIKIPIGRMPNGRIPLGKRIFDSLPYTAQTVLNEKLKERKPIITSKKILEKEIDKRNIILSLRTVDPKFIRQTLTPVISTIPEFAIGVSDLMLVRQEIAGYEIGEISHVENILLGENKKKIHRDLNRIQQVYETETESTNSTENELSTTDRFELSREAEDIVNTVSQTNYWVSASYGGVVDVDVDAGKTSSDAWENSKQVSENYAKEITHKAIESISKKIKERRETTSVHEVEVVNEHDFINEKGTKHIRGIYQWLDKKYNVELRRYDERTIYEFVLPRPATFLFSNPPEKSEDHLIPPLPPKIISFSLGLFGSDPFGTRKSRDLQPEDITLSNYGTFASRYQAEIPTPPLLRTTVSVTASQELSDEKKENYNFVKDLTIPSGYYLESAVYNLLLRNDELQQQFDSTEYSALSKYFLSIGGILREGELQEPDGSSGNEWGIGFISIGGEEDDELLYPPEKITDQVPVALAVTGVDQSVLTVTLHCKLTKDKFREWQISTFDAIMKAYKQRVQEYEEKMALRELKGHNNLNSPIIQTRHPGKNKKIIRNEIRKLCISLLRMDNFEFASNLYSNDKDNIPEMNISESLERGREVQFLEQAFEWENISYRFYPYFWADKKTWYDSIMTNDNDDEFEEFLKAGAVRVNVPVRPFYEESVLSYQSTKKVPQDYKIIDIKYVPLVEEIKESHGASSEGERIAEWEHTVPTSLVYLKEEDNLPTY